MSEVAHEAYIGLISGTSVDSIDAVLVSFEPELKVHAALAESYPAALQDRLLQLGQSNTCLALEDFGQLDHLVGRAFAKPALALVERAAELGLRVAAIGSHGQTLRHSPRSEAPFTLQVGDPNLIAEACRCPTVADFRRRDLAAGGQAAPLLPALHAALFQRASEQRAVLNLGGIANLTLLPATAEVRGFDTGPANGLLDAWCRRHTGHPYDRDGAWADSGTTPVALLQAWLSDPWFQLPPPKSSGRDQFHLDWLQQRAGDLQQYRPQDVQAALLQLSAASVATALLQTQPDTQRLLVCGGGVHNRALMRALGERLPTLAVESTAVHGLDPDVVEAVGFAWLARRTVRGEPGNLPSVTGARGPRVLGAIYPA